MAADLVMTRSRHVARARVLLIIAAGLAVTGATPGARQSRVSPWLETAVRQASADDRLAVWVYFADKGEAAPAGSTEITARAAARRAVRGAATARAAFEDRALAASYVARVATLASRVRQQSRWLNALSVEATPAQIDAIAALSYVSRVDVVRRYRRLREEPVEPLDADGRGVRSGARHAADEPLDYGTGIDQLRQIRVPELHQRGLHGEGVIVAVFDSGFPNLTHEAFASMTIVAERDFVDGHDSVRETTDAHGTNTLSTIGSYAPGRLVGPAYGASYILAVTENVRSETPVEEDNWAAAAEWAEALGADVISSSLGYLDFDLPYTSYTAADMNGETAITTRAAALAAERGVVVVNSAGNAGLDRATNTLGAPADGVRVVSVGAVTRTGARAGFSSVGPTADGRIKPDVAAMGVSVKVARHVENAYGAASGTSFSCPLTAGVVALILQAHPDYTPDDVLTALRGSASQAGAPDTLLGWGIVDAVAAVDMSLPVPAAAARRP
jgi:subtilisin family serine protease